VAEDMLFPLVLKNAAKNHGVIGAMHSLPSTWHDPMNQGGQGSHKNKNANQTHCDDLQGLEPLHIVIKTLSTAQA
jgi:hypothetical protein